MVKSYALWELFYITKILYLLECLLKKSIQIICRNCYSGSVNTHDPDEPSQKAAKVLGPEWAGLF